MPQYHFPGLAPGDRWCVTAVNWLRAHEEGAAAYVVLASTHERALEVVSLAALQEHTVDVPRTRDLSAARSLSRINGAACDEDPEHEAARQRIIASLESLVEQIYR